MDFAARRGRAKIGPRKGPIAPYAEELGRAAIIESLANLRTFPDVRGAEAAGKLPCTAPISASPTGGCSASTRLRELFCRWRTGACGGFCDAALLKAGCPIPSTSSVLPTHRRLSMARSARNCAPGAKRKHWMWFVFPQIAGLGHSAAAQFYAIGSAAEARAYLAHPSLGPRLRQCTDLVLLTNGRSAHEIFGSPDDLKFRSSMTLFGAVADDPALFEAALKNIFPGAATLAPAIAFAAAPDRGEDKRPRFMKMSCANAIAPCCWRWRKNSTKL